MTTHLLMDDRVVIRAEGAELLPGPITKHGANPMLRADRPWEVRLDNVYANIVREPTGEFRCWYSPFLVDEAESTTPMDRRGEVRYRAMRREMGVCLATSRDGVHWTKPELGQCDFEGSLRNNIVFRGPHGAGVFRDERDADPQRRYKTFYARDDHMTEVAFSPDGVRWSSPNECPDVRAIGDTHNNAFWSSTLNRYVAFTRLWSKGPFQGVRIVGRTESPDFVHWSPAKPVLEGLDASHQIYAMPVFELHGGFVGLPMIFDTSSDRVHSELAWSFDSITWRRIAPGRSLIPNGPPGTWDWGCVYAGACPIVDDDKQLLFYGGSDHPHSNWRTSGLGLARLGRDRFAGYYADDGHVVTNMLSRDGDQLTLNVSASAGRIVVEALDEHQSVLASGEVDSVDGPAALVRWTTQPPTSRSVALRFHLRSATLFAFSWRHSAS